MNDAINFEWDDDKADANRKKHGVTFEQAIRAFRDRYAIEQLDEREDYGEERVNLIGMSGDVMLHVTFTERHERIRIISARKAERGEQDDYYRQNEA